MGAIDQEDLSVAVVGSLPTLAQMGWGWGHHSLLWGTVMMIGWWLVIAAVVVIVVRSLNRQGRAEPTSGATEVLAGRYARGEIDEQEYRSRLSVLEGR